MYIVNSIFKIKFHFVILKHFCLNYCHRIWATISATTAMENYPLRHLLDVTKTEIYSRDVEIAISGIKQIRRKYGDKKFAFQEHQSIESS